MDRLSLPIDVHLPAIAAAVQHENTIIVKAAPGAGKTTRIPPALIPVVPKTILVLEPRRLAARLSAERVAEELGEPCGKTSGFHIRFEQRFSTETRVKFITEGMFLRYLQSDPSINDVSCIVLDEFHERHIHSDVALAITRHLQANQRPDLKLVIMSATLDLRSLEEAIPNAKIFESEGRVFPVDIEYLPPMQNENRHRVTIAAVKQVLNKTENRGHILVFLPGAAEIRRLAEDLRSEIDTGKVEILELRAEIPFQEQHKVFVESGRRKIILATNVAETSLTIPGVTAVVDTGVAKIPGYASWSGLPTLDIRPVSRSSCIQRSGRAGRTAPGIALRLYAKSDFETRPLQEKPEIQRSDLAQITLDILTTTAALSINSLSQVVNLPWLTPPPENMLVAAEKTLRFLGALDDTNKLTELGRDLARWPLHPRLGRIVQRAVDLKIGRQGALAAALLSEGMILRRGSEAHTFADSDLFLQMETFEASNRKQTIDRRTREQLDPGKLKRVADLVDALSTGIPHAALGSFSGKLAEGALTQSLLAGFADRVAQVRRRVQSTQGTRIELNLCLGGGAVLAPSSVVQKEEFLIALEADDSPTQSNAASSTAIRVASAVSAEQLLDDPAGLVRESSGFFWDDEAKRVRGSSKILYGNLVLDESQLDCRSADGEKLLLRTLLGTWPKPFENDEPMTFFRVRAKMLSQKNPSIVPPTLEGDSLADFCAFICSGKLSFREITERSMDDYLAQYLDPGLYAMLEREFPRNIRIGHNRQTKIYYADGQPPWIESRLQDFFGTSETPCIASGTVRLVVHLLAPNRQALQVTQDLRSFWERAYPTLRREYMRRYPRHYWPENPLEAEPPPPKRPRH